MSEQKARAMALQDIASQIMPTLLEGLSSKKKKEKLATMPGDLKKKVKKKEQLEDFDELPNPFRNPRRDDREEAPRAKLSLTDLMSKQSYSEKKFAEQNREKISKKKKFGKRK